MPRPRWHLSMVDLRVTDDIRAREDSLPFPNGKWAVLIVLLRRTRRSRCNRMARKSPSRCSVTPEKPTQGNDRTGTASSELGCPRPWRTTLVPDVFENTHPSHAVGPPNGKSEVLPHRI